MIDIDKSKQELQREIEDLKVQNKQLIEKHEKEISRRDQLENELRFSEAQFRNLFEDIENISVQGYGPDGTTKFWNYASEQLYGFNQKEAIGKKCCGPNYSPRRT